MPSLLLAGLLAALSAADAGPPPFAGSPRPTARPRPRRPGHAEAGHPARAGPQPHVAIASAELRRAAALVEQARAAWLPNASFQALYEGYGVAAASRRPSSRTAPSSPPPTPSSARCSSTCPSWPPPPG